MKIISPQNNRCIPFFGQNTHNTFNMPWCLFDKYFQSNISLFWSDTRKMRSDANSDLHCPRSARVKIFSFNCQHQEGLHYAWGGLVNCIREHLCEGDFKTPWDGTENAGDTRLLYSIMYYTIHFTVYTARLKRNSSCKLYRVHIIQMAASASVLTIFTNQVSCVDNEL